MAERLAQGMAAQGHKVIVATLGPPGSGDELGGTGIQVIRLALTNLYWNLDASTKPAALKVLWHIGDIYNAAMGHKVESVIRDFSPDVVCAHNLAGFSAAVYLAARRRGVPLVQVLHDHYFICPYSTCYRRGRPCTSPCQPCRMVRLPHRYLTRHASAVVGVSRYILQKVTGQGMFHGVPATVIHNVREIALQGKQRPWSDSPRVFGYLGALVPHKGVELLVRAFKDTAAPGTTLLVAGMGDSRYVASLKRLAESAPVEFIGQAQPEHFLATLDVLIVPSLCHDSLPTTAIESCLSGVPVIASNRGGIPEIIQSGYNGLLFDPQTPGALAACIQQLCGDPVLFHRLKENTCRSAAAFGDLDGWLSQYGTVLESAIARHSRSVFTTNADPAR